MASYTAFLWACLLGSFAPFALSSQVSPVQKVIQLLDELKAKIVNDVAKDSAEMNEYAAFCNEALREKGYAIKTAAQAIEDIQAQIEDSKATILSASEDVQELSTAISAKESELAEVTHQRKVQREDFEFAEKALLKDIKKTEVAITKVSAGMSFLQAKHALPDGVREALQAITSSTAIIGGADKEKLQSLMQSSMGTATGASLDESNELSLKAALAQPEQKTFESQSGGVLEAVKGMKEKAENQLADLRKQEMQDGHEFAMLEDGLNNEIKNLKEKHAAATSLKQSSTQDLADAEGELGETQKTKADDEKYSSTLTMDFGTKSEEWEERHRSAVGEMGALDTAKQILVKGVTALIQTSVKRSVSKDDYQRLRSVTILRDLGRRFHSFALVELATSAATDPFVKIRGLIEDMIANLMAEAAEEASKKAFCDEEMSKSTANEKDKQSKADNHQARIDEASAEIAQLKEAVEILLAEVAEIDKAQAEATALRNEEKAQNMQAMKDFSGSADAVVAAIGALRAYYEGASLVQTNSRVAAHQPKTDAANNIISVLEAAETEFTQLHAETESAESSAAHAFDELTQENKVAKAQKEADAKSKESTIKSLTVSLSHHTEDHAAVSQELAAVKAYLEKLKPECETKVMSYEDRKAARQSEIEGLKEALSILEGN